MSGFDRFMVANDVGRSRKMRTLFTVPERWAWIGGVLPIASEAAERGTFTIGDQPADARALADEADVPISVAKSALAKFRRLGMLVTEEGVERVADWHDYNPTPTGAKSNAERQRLWRQRHAGHNGNGVTEAVSRALRASVTPRYVITSRPVTEVRRGRTATAYAAAVEELRRRCGATAAAAVCVR